MRRFQLPDGVISPEFGTTMEVVQKTVDWW